MATLDNLEQSELTTTRVAIWVKKFFKIFAFFF